MFGKLSIILLTWALSVNDSLSLWNIDLVYPQMVHWLIINNKTIALIKNVRLVSLNLESGRYFHYRKPNIITLYIHTKSSHPPCTKKPSPTFHLPCSETEIEKAKPTYRVSTSEDLNPTCTLKHGWKYQTKPWQVYDEYTRDWMLNKYIS